MQNLTEIDFNALRLDIFRIWGESFLLTAGEMKRFNSMTIGWGSLGIMWRVPIVMVGVRPSRHTFQFMEEYDTFTVCGFAPEYKAALTIMGTKSGRDLDKVQAAGLTPCASKSIEAPAYQEASLIFECRKIYADDVQKENSSQLIQDFYKDRDYHHLYIGQVLKVLGDENK
jgi:flavin reductase (DIM6/NTAB) family NADH-FMN oxidoreductase RutF